MASPLWTRYRQVGKGRTEEAVARLQTLRGWLELSAGTRTQGASGGLGGAARGLGGRRGPSHVPRQYPRGLQASPHPGDQHLAGQHLCTFSSSSWRSAPGSCLFALSLPPYPPGWDPPGVSAPVPLACPWLGCVCLWLTARPLLTCSPLILSCSPAPGTELINSKRSLYACGPHFVGGVRGAVGSGAWSWRISALGLPLYYPFSPLYAQPQPGFYFTTK